MDELVLKGLRYHAKHGYFDHERVEGNHFEVDLLFTLYLDPSARKDDLNLTVDYSKAQLIVTEVMEGKPVKLLETLAFRIGEQLERSFNNIDSFQVTVRKLNPPMKTESLFSEVTMKWPR